MKRELSPYHLGASLYLPATHKNLFALVCESKYPEAKSVIIDFEDALLEGELDGAQNNLKEVLTALIDQELLVFVRPRSPEHFERLLGLEFISKLDGFVFAKCDTSTMYEYFSLLKDKDFWCMPVLESTELFDSKLLQEMSDCFVLHKEDILSLRFGGEDISTHLGLKRQCDTILYDFYPLVHLLSSLILRFKPLGFNITAPVYTCFCNEKGLISEVNEDLKMGLFGKTVIHPKQIAVVHDAYKVKEEVFNQAQSLLDKDAKAIISHEGMMLETIPHRRWAAVILEQEKHYGLI